MRYCINLILLTALGIVLLSIAAAAERPYLLLYAFDEEGAAFSKLMTVSGTDTVLGRTVQSGSAGGRDVILAESGIGMTNAAMTTQRLIDQYHPAVVIFTGIAGAVDSAVQIGDIVIASSWVQHDFGYIGADGYTVSGIRVFDLRQDSVTKMSQFPVDSALLETARAAAADQLELDSVGQRQPAITVGGVGASGNTFIDNREKRDWLANTLNAKIVDMESAAVMHVCVANGVRAIVMRSASDLAGGSGSLTASAELDNFFKVAAGNSAKAVLAVLKRLPVVPTPSN
jgi:adenosylhomocysteine nucleosidase